MPLHLELVDGGTQLRVYLLEESAGLSLASSRLIGSFPSDLPRESRGQFFMDRSYDYEPSTFEVVDDVDAFEGWLREYTRRHSLPGEEFEETIRMVISAVKEKLSPEQGGFRYGQYL